VARYLSERWFDDVEAVLPDSGAMAADLVVQHVVSDGPDGEVAYHVRFRNGTLAVTRGQAADPDVTFAEDYATAAAVAQGQLGTPAALLAGRIRVGGDLTALLAHHHCLPSADPVPAAVRAATTY
jgi:putative sterol carrier protein